MNSLTLSFFITMLFAYFQLEIFCYFFFIHLTFLARTYSTVPILNERPICISIGVCECSEMKFYSIYCSPWSVCAVFEPAGRLAAGSTHVTP